MSIRSVFGRDRWRFVKVEINPADVPTRISSMGVGFLVLLSSCHNTLSPVGTGEDISTDGTNGNTVDEVNAEAVLVRVVRPTSCFPNTT